MLLAMLRDKVQHYRHQAARLRAVADDEDEQGLKSDILWLAEEYDKWASDATRRPGNKHQ